MMAADWRRMLDDGIDPSEVKKQKAEQLTRLLESPREPSVKDVVYSWIRFNEERGRWKNALKPKELVWDGYC